MITIISGTNRPDSYTQGVAARYAELMRSAGEEVHVLDLMELPGDFIRPDMYDHVHPVVEEWVEHWIAPVHKFVFIIPEYNGSYPGILKVFLDSLPPRLWRDKKAAIIGVSSGRAGNLRGQEHLTGVLHYLKMHVHYNKPKLSGIERLVDHHGEVMDANTLKLLEEHVREVVGW